MDVINIKNHFYKALRFLDLGETERASGILEEIVIEAVFSSLGQTVS